MLHSKADVLTVTLAFAKLPKCLNVLLDAIQRLAL